MIIELSILSPIVPTVFFCVWKNYKNNRKHRKLQMLNYIVGTSNGEHKHMGRDYMHDKNRKHYDAIILGTTAPFANDITFELHSD